MGLLPRMPSHMNHQHVLSFERFLIPGATDPAADKGLLGGMDVVCVDVLYQVVLSWELKFAIHLEKVHGVKITKD